MNENRVKHIMDAGLQGLQMHEWDRQSILHSARAGKRAKKKWSTALVLAAVLLALTVTALAVSALRGFAFLDGREFGQPLACAVMEDTLYVLTLDGLNAWHAEADEPQRLLRWRDLPPMASPSRVRLAAGEELLLLDEQRGRVWAFRQRDMALLWEADEMAETIPFRETDEAVCQDGFLFLQMDPAEDGKNSRDSLLYRLKLADGTVEQLQVPNLYCIAAYRDGMLLGVQQEKDEELVLVSINAHTGETQSMTRMPMGSLKGVTYSEKHDAIFGLSNGQLCRWTGDAWQTVCAHAVPHLSFFYGVFGDSYVTASHEGIQFLPIGAEAPEQQVLIIRGLMDASGHDHAFQLANPGVSISRRREMHFCQEEAVQVIRQGDPADLFCLMLTSDEVAVLHSTVHPLDSSMLRKDLEAMTPFVRDLLMKDAMVYGVPAQLSVNGWEVRDDWAEAVPQTMAELLTLQTEWAEEGMCTASAHAEQGWDREDFAVSLLMQAIREHRAGTLHFTDEAFVEALKQLQQADFAPQTGEAGTSAFVYGALQLQGAQETQPESRRRVMTAPVISEQSAPSAPATIILYVLNPNSSNPETALRYLEWLASHRLPDEEARLKPETAQPALHHGVEEWVIAPIVQQHRQWEQENGLPHDEAALQARLDNLLAMPENWAVTQEKLDAYRTLVVPYLCMNAAYPSAHHDVQEKEMLEVMQVCLDGETTAEACARRLEDMME